MVVVKNLAFFVSSKVPTDAQKDTINAAIAKLYEYGLANGGEFVQRALKWIKSRPINTKTSNEATTLKNYQSGAQTWCTNGKPEIKLPPIMQVYINLMLTPYKLA